jgi:hypothetical protein
MVMLPATQAEHLPAAALTPIYHVTYLQGFAVFIDLRLVKPNLFKEERNQVLLQDLAVDIATVTEVFMMPSTQLLCVGLVDALADVPWSAAGGVLIYGWLPFDCLSQVCVSG